MSTAAIEALETRKATLLAQIAALDASAVGGGPDTSGPGDHVQQVNYRMSLYDELTKIEQSIDRMRGPTLVKKQGRLR